MPVPTGWEGGQKRKDVAYAIGPNGEYVQAAIWAHLTPDLSNAAAQALKAWLSKDNGYSDVKLLGDPVPLGEGGTVTGSVAVQYAAVWTSDQGASGVEGIVVAAVKSNAQVLWVFFETPKGGLQAALPTFKQVVVGTIGSFDQS
jgi:hypothetical protein